MQAAENSGKLLVSMKNNAAANHIISDIIFLLF